VTLERIGKKRYFIVKNEADNYRIEYYEKEEGKLKGTIPPCGYEVVALSEEERKSHGDLTLKFQHWDERRRVWFIKCLKEEEKQEWIDTLNYCGKRASPDSGQTDPLIKSAFERAMRVLRWRFWIWGLCVGTEAEQLAYLLNEIVTRDLLGEIINDIPDNPVKGQTIKIVKSIVASSIGAAVSASWTTSTSAVISLKIFSRINSKIIINTNF